MVKSVLDYIKILERMKFYDIVVSLKASNITDTIEAYRKIAKLRDYPLHLGVTATGLPFSGAIKSGIALGALLLEGIGDTIRVSLTDEPQEEVKAAKAVLEAVGLRSFGPEVISCPTCGRCEVDLVKIVKDLETRLQTTDHSPPRPYLSAGRGLQTPPPKVAVMGCVVNGPGEAREADVGVAFGAKDGLLFKKGKPIKKVHVGECVKVLLREMRQ
jgi:(E)-4-hydroxy-3-methylbut-2-enyl-diphosphate synthase